MSYKIYLKTLTIIALYSYTLIIIRIAYTYIFSISQHNIIYNTHYYETVRHYIWLCRPANPRRITAENSSYKRTARFAHTHYTCGGVVACHTSRIILIYYDGRPCIAYTWNEKSHGWVITRSKRSTAYCSFDKYSSCRIVRICGRRRWLTSRVSPRWSCCI